MTDKNTYKLFDDYSIEITTDAAQFQKFFDKYKKTVFSGTGALDLNEVMTEKEKGCIKRLSENLEKIYRLRIYILKGNKKIGWFFGKQTDSETFFMTNTGILKKYRNLGIYKKMLPVIIEIIKKKGFQKISSSHNVNNNHIIVAKLKAGFVISGFEIRDIFGMIVQLTYFFNKVRGKVIQYRTGAIKPDKRLKQLLKHN
ncbi:MAG: hypothetical protein IPL53_07190 [Ignavibacteria bacterium]|nr:hypothetical protein [Ignavibacteria bacterium]